MNAIEIEKCCPECESTLVDDIQNGERICSGCGVSLQNKWQTMVQKQKAVV